MSRKNGLTRQDAKRHISVMDELRLAKLQRQTSNRNDYFHNSFRKPGWTRENDELNEESARSDILGGSGLAARLEDSLASLNYHDGEDEIEKALKAVAAEGRGGPLATDSESWNKFMEHMDSLQEGDLADDGGQHSRHGIPLYSFPEQLQRWGESQQLPHINWGNLFFDLFYVAAAYNLGTFLLSTINPDQWRRGLVYFIGIFGSLFNMWENKVVYEARYSVIDYAHRVLEVLRIFFIAFAVVHITPVDLLGDEKSAEAFMISLSFFLESLIHILLKVELVLVGRGDVDAIRNHSKRRLLFNLCPTALVFLAATVISGIQYFGNDSDDDIGGNRRMASSSESYESDSYKNDDREWKLADLPFGLFLLAYVLNGLFEGIRMLHVFDPNKMDLRAHFVPMNIDFCIHRYGEWTMLMLGESVLSLLIVDTTESKEYYVVVCVGVLTVIVLQALKFESEPSHADGHALWRSLAAGQIFSWLIQLLSLSLIAFGVSFKVMLKKIHNDSLKESIDCSTGYDDNETSYGGDEYGGSDTNSTYDEHLDDDDHRRILAATDPCARRLAALSPATDLAVATLFCVSLTIVLISIELMANSHQGFRKNYSFLFRNGDKENWSFNKRNIFIKSIKLGLLCLVATLPVWETRPVAVALSGFIAVALFAILTVLNWGMVNHEEQLRRILKSINIARSMLPKTSKQSDIEPEQPEQEMSPDPGEAIDNSNLDTVAEEDGESIDLDVDLEA